MLKLEVAGKKLELEHSLVSMSKWEERYEKPFFPPNKDTQITPDEMLGYFQCMVVRPKRGAELVHALSNEQQEEIANYINAKKSATTVREIPEKPGAPKENVTSELIYYWMNTFNIPFEPCERWHLNRLLMLIRIHGIKNAPAEKQSPADMAAEYRRLNEERRKQFQSKG